MEWKLMFYLRPSLNYSKISDNDITNLDRAIQKAKEQDEVYIPDEYYNIKDINNKTVIEYLFNEEYDDKKSYLLEIITKQKKSDINYSQIKKQNEYGYIIFTQDVVDDELKDICMKRPEDIILIKRHYILLVKTYKDYIYRIKGAFPDLVFHNDSLKKIDKLGDIRDNIEELTRHLSVLNDNGRALYIENNGNESEILKKIKSTYGIKCSGKGSNEGKSFKVNLNGIEITCNPHTKFYDGNNDQRIYFSWGRDEINNHAIIIAHIGDHWQ